MTTSEIKAQTVETIAGSVSDPNRAMALRTTQSIILALDEQICQIEREVPGESLGVVQRTAPHTWP